MYRLSKLRNQPDLRLSYSGMWCEFRQHLEMMGTLEIPPFFFWPGYYFILCHFEDFKQFISKSHSFCLIISNVEGHEVYCLLDL